ncbi:MAG: F0F1 ATP synthase subunit epsilon [Phycisphaeraceae bacterium]|nr:F0F1 ATP synthase subunit epsilon [Phycisphaeraceae bacterium]MCW5762320.1 F0F1 ATP synthase subunit epsilon [Phycisphaeraceae bacterium]
MAENTIRCRVVTPTHAVLDDQVRYASVPLHDGLAGFMPGRSPLVARLGLGELRLDFPDSRDSKGGSRSYFIDGGFAKMSSEGLTILAQEAMPIESIAKSDAQAELAAAESRKVDIHATDALAQSARISHDRNRARLKVRLASQSQAKGI